MSFEERAKRMEKMFYNQRYNFAKMQANATANLAPSSSITRLATSQEKYNALHKEWQKTEIGSPEEKAFEDTMKPLARIIVINKLATEDK